MKAVRGKLSKISTIWSAGGSFGGINTTILGQQINIQICIRKNPPNSLSNEHVGFWFQSCLWPASQPASKPASQQASQQASKPASQPASRQASKPASQKAS